MTKECYTITEAMKILKVSRPTIYMWLENKQLKGTKLPNGKWRIPKTELQKYTKGAE